MITSTILSIAAKRQPEDFFNSPSDSLPPLFEWTRHWPKPHEQYRRKAMNSSDALLLAAFVPAATAQQARRAGTAGPGPGRNVTTLTGPCREDASRSPAKRPDGSFSTRRHRKLVRSCARQPRARPQRASRAGDRRSAEECVERGVTKSSSRQKAPATPPCGFNRPPTAPSAPGDTRLPESRINNDPAQRARNEVLRCRASALAGPTAILRRPVIGDAFRILESAFNTSVPHHFNEFAI